MCDPDNEEITLGRKVYPVERQYVLFVKALLEARGNWIASPQMRQMFPELKDYTKLNRAYKKKLPKPILSLIEGRRGGGFRLKQSEPE